MSIFEIGVLGVILVFFHPQQAAANPSATTARYAKQFDFSEALQPKTAFLGFIEPNYQRLHMKFTSVSKDHSNAFLYRVRGQSTTKQNTCSFSGTISIDEIQEDTKIHNGVDDEFKDSGMKAQGKLIGVYEIKESPKQKFCGLFKGKMTLLWFVDRDGKIHYDDIESSYSDNFKNNQYEGTWSPYNSEKRKVANWGEYRIPHSGDLDIGAGEFSADPKYKKQGW